MNKKVIFVNTIGLFIARASIFTLNPIAIAYFVALSIQNCCLPMNIAVILIGICTVSNVKIIIKYALSMILILIVEEFVRRRGKKYKTLFFGILGGLATIFISLSGIIYFNENQDKYLLMALLEGIIIMSLTVVFNGAIEFILKEKKDLSNEQLISISIMIFTFLLGISDFQIETLSFMKIVLYFAIAFLGYKYGCGSGGVIGAICGILLDESVGIGIGVGCIFGICIGIYRNMGKILAAILYLMTIISIGYLYADFLIQLENIRSLTIATIIFACLPKKILYIVENKREDKFINKNIQYTSFYKMRDFAEAFKKLSFTFAGLSSKKKELSNQDINNIFEQVSENYCYSCNNFKNCVNTCQYDTYKAVYNAITLDRQGDTIECIANNCIDAWGLLEETKKYMEFAKLKLLWHNQMAESREAIAGQLGEVAEMINEFSENLYDGQEISGAEKVILKKALKSKNIDTRKVAIIQKSNNKKEVYIIARMNNNSYITTKDISVLVGNVLKKKMKADESCKSILGSKYETFTFLEEAKYKVLTGTARIAKQNENICGDNFSFSKINESRFIMALSDGMGSGETAYEDSETVVDLLEQFMEAGFKEESTIKLINSILVLRSEEQTLSTIDMAIFDLFSGRCEFIKIGAAATFIKRKDEVKVIMSYSIPAGVFNTVDCDREIFDLRSGDMIIMMTDGVLDCLNTQNKEEYMVEMIKNINSKNAKEVANTILEQSKKESGGEAIDDMTVVVATIWKM